MCSAFWTKSKGKCAASSAFLHMIAAHEDELRYEPIYAVDSDFLHFRWSICNHWLCLEFVSAGRTFSSHWHFASAKCYLGQNTEYTSLNAFYCSLFAFMICRWQFASLPTVSKSIDFNRHHLRNGWHCAIPFSHSFVIVRKLHITICESKWILFVRLKNSKFCSQSFVPTNSSKRSENLLRTI